ncbi:MAG TPA: SDR family oxidoreductase [Acidimicrobiia bacterium]|nr:SDR family oxidoreductase [Acidimicrobiia bacterium]
MSEAYDLRDKRVLVTGGSSGIGAALAEGFAARGAVVGICARRRDRLDTVLGRVRAHQPASMAWTIDLADLDGLEAFAASVEADLGGVDVVVHNAGIPKRRTVFDLTPDVVESVMRINYLSPARLTLTLLPTLVARRGRIVFVSSVAARLSPPGEAAYAASKAALSAWAESLQVDLRDTGVRTHVVNPGIIDTELFQLPDNDPSVAPIDPLPVDAIVEPVLSMIERGDFEVYVPEWFADVVASKYRDVGAFLEGSIAWAREQTQP